MVAANAGDLCTVTVTSHVLPNPEGISELLVTTGDNVQKHFNTTSRVIEALLILRKDHPCTLFEGVELTLLSDFLRINKFPSSCTMVDDYGHAAIDPCRNASAARAILNFLLDGTGSDCVQLQNFYECVSRVVRGERAQSRGHAVRLVEHVVGCAFRHLHVAHTYVRVGDVCVGGGYHQTLNAHHQDAWIPQLRGTVSLLFNLILAQFVQRTDRDVVKRVASDKWASRLLQELTAKEVKRLVAFIAEGGIDSLLNAHEFDRVNALLAHTGHQNIVAASTHAQVRTCRSARARVDDAEDAAAGNGVAPAPAELRAKVAAAHAAHKEAARKRLECAAALRIAPSAAAQLPRPTVDVDEPSIAQHDDAAAGEADGDFDGDGDRREPEGLTDERALATHVEPTVEQELRLAVEAARRDVSAWWCDYLSDLAVQGMLPLLCSKVASINAQTNAAAVLHVAALRLKVRREITALVSDDDYIWRAQLLRKHWNNHSPTLAKPKFALVPRLNSSKAVQLPFTRTNVRRHLVAAQRESAVFATFVDYLRSVFEAARSVRHITWSGHLHEPLLLAVEKGTRAFTTVCYDINAAINDARAIDSRARGSPCTRGDDARRVDDTPQPAPPWWIVNGTARAGAMQAMDVRAAASVAEEASAHSSMHIGADTTDATASDTAVDVDGDMGNGAALTDAHVADGARDETSTAAVVTVAAGGGPTDLTASSDGMSEDVHTAAALLPPTPSSPWWYRIYHLFKVQNVPPYKILLLGLDNGMGGVDGLVKFLHHLQDDDAVHEGDHADDIRRLQEWTLNMYRRNGDLCELNAVKYHTERGKEKAESYAADAASAAAADAAAARAAVASRAAPAAPAGPADVQYTRGRRGKHRHRRRRWWKRARALGKRSGKGKKTARAGKKRKRRRKRLKRREARQLRQRNLDRHHAVHFRISRKMWRHAQHSDQIAAETIAAQESIVAGADAGVYAGKNLRELLADGTQPKKNAETLEELQDRVEYEAVLAPLFVALRRSELLRRVRARQRRARVTSDAAFVNRVVGVARSAAFVKAGFHVVVARGAWGHRNGRSFGYARPPHERWYRSLTAEAAVHSNIHVCTVNEGHSSDTCGQIMLDGKPVALANVHDVLEHDIPAAIAMRERERAAAARVAEANADTGDAAMQVEPDMHQEGGARGEAPLPDVRCCGGELRHATFKDENGDIREIWRSLYCCKCKTLWQRDVNAIFNIWLIAAARILYGTTLMPAHIRATRARRAEERAAARAQMHG